MSGSIIGWANDIHFSKLWPDNSPLGLGRELVIERYLVPVTELCDEKTEMFALFSRHFDGVTREQFEADLNQKKWVLLLKENKIIKGFSTLQFYEAKLDSEPVRIVYSGDTITDPSMWSSSALAQAWSAAIKAIHQSKREKLYWLLISSGYRTYRLMSVFWQQFYPHYDRQTPPLIAQFMDRLCRSQFQDYYSPEEGIVRFPQPQVLGHHLRDIPPEKLKDPHVAFFLQKNPGYIRGDELVCLAEVSESNLTRAGLRLWHSKVPLSIPFTIDS